MRFPHDQLRAAAHRRRLYGVGRGPPRLVRRGRGSHTGHREDRAVGAEGCGTSAGTRSLPASRSSRNFLTERRSVGVARSGARAASALVMSPLAAWTRATFTKWT